jgi:hypothetical protein
VLVTEVTRKDVPSVKEWVAMLDGFVNAAIIAPVSVTSFYRITKKEPP